MLCFGLYLHSLYGQQAETFFKMSSFVFLRGKTRRSSKFGITWRWV